MEKYYVSMTDKFLSGWGKAEGKIAKFISICDTYEEALIVADNARSRKDQKDIKISSEKPQYKNGRYYVEYKTKEDKSRWYIAGSFKK